MSFLVSVYLGVLSENDHWVATYMSTKLLVVRVTVLILVRDASSFERANDNLNNTDLQLLKEFVNEISSLSFNSLKKTTNLHSPIN